ncbi:MAG: GAF domain-containing protein [Chloroflexi bacterium]|nr:GAF domain-containing protein [Chloroflexota bacterium]
MCGGEDRVAIISKIQTEGSCQNYELELQRIDGEHFWALLTARLIQFEGESAIITSLIDITERREAQNALARQAADLQAVAALSTQVAAIQDPQTLMEMVVQETQRQFDLYHCHIFLLDEAGRQLRIQACGWHPAAQEYGTHGASVIPINNEKSLVARAARTRQAVVVNDVHNDPHWLPNELLPDTRSEMAVPMITGGRVLGVLDVQSAELNHFTEDDVQIQSTLAAQMAVALENARSLAKSQQAIEEMNLLTRRLTREGWSEYATLRADRDAGYRYDLGQLSPIKIEEESEAVALAAETAVPSTNGHLSHSLMVHGETIGHLTVFNETEAEQLDDDAALIMAAVAEQLSVRVENIRLSDQTQQALAQTQDQAQRLSLLNEISAEMSNAETLNEVFNIIFDRIPDLMKADRVSLAMLRPDGENIEIIDYRGEMNIPVGTTIRLADTLMNEALQQNRIIVNHEARPDSDINSSMIAPILSAGRGIGVLNIGSKRVNSMTEQDETLLQQLATMLSSIIENKQLLAAAQTRADRERLVRTITDKIPARHRPGSHFDHCPPGNQRNAGRQSVGGPTGRQNPTA